MLIYFNIVIVLFVCLTVYMYRISLNRSRIGINACLKLKHGRGIQLNTCVCLSTLQSTFKLPGHKFYVVTF